MGTRRHGTISILSVSVVLLILALSPHQSSVQGATPDKKVCKTIKKHGQKKRVCQNSIPKPTRTPGPTPTPAPPFTVRWSARPCSVIIQSSPGSPSVQQPGCADLGYTVSNDHGVITLTQKDAGHTYQISKFSMGIAYDNTSYTLNMYLKAIKSTPKDGSLAGWSPEPNDFALTAANGHPYTTASCGLPPFPYVKSIYNGEWDEGWACSGSIDPHYVATTFTWSLSGSGTFGSPTTYIRYSIPLVDVTVKPR